MIEVNPGTTKLAGLCKKVDGLKAALREMHARRRAQEKADRQRLEALIGYAVLADAEADAQVGDADRRAHIRHVLDRQVSSALARAFLKAKGWL